MIFSFQNKGNNFDRVFETFFFKSVCIDIATNSELSEDLQLPTYKDGCKSIKEKLNKKEFDIVKDFVSQNKGKFTRGQAKDLLQSTFNLTDCSLVW